MPGKGLGFREVEAKAADAQYEIQEFPVVRN
jgi:hypothetical protein